MGLQTETFDSQLSLRYGPISLEIEVTDPELVTEILRQPPESRDRYTKEALRLGILAMRMASGHIDTAAIRSAGERLISDFRETLATRGGELTAELTGALKGYFDPDSGALTQRLRSLVEQDGEIERALRRQVGGDDSALAHTLAAHLGETSPLFKLLSPDDAAGLRSSIERTLEDSLTQQRESILGEFSLDRKESALRRMIEELEGRHAELKSDLKGKVDAVIGEFSLDRADSALSRLVSRVEKAQKTITDEFSLDKGDSALSRMSKQMNEFQVEVREALAALGASRAEAKRSTRHGLDFEERAGELIGDIAQRLGDIHSATGATTGTIKNCKVGDHLVELGPDSPAPGARIVWESKQAKSYDLRRALDEMERARKNRSAQVGVFVFSAAAAPAGLEPLARYGDDLIAVWDADDPSSDVVIRAAYTTARALALRVRDVSGEAEVAARELERATRSIEKQLKFLAEIQRMAETTRSHGDKIASRAERMREQLAAEIERIDTHLAGLLTES